MNDKKIIVVSVIGMAVLLIGGITLVFKLTAKPAVVEALPVAVASTANKNTAMTVQQKTEQQIALEKMNTVSSPSPPVAVQAAKPVRAPAAPAKPGTISGAAWLTKNDASSVLMRGMNVAAIAPTVSTGPIAQQAQSSIPGWQKDIDGNRNLIDRYNQMIKDDEQSIKEFANLGQSTVDSYKSMIAGDKKQIGELEEMIKKDQAKIASIQSLPQTLPATMDVLDAYRLLKGCDMGGFASFPKDFVSLVQTKTNVDGKYTLKDVPAGNVYVIAFFGTSQAWADWMVPLTIKGGEEISLDLQNDNAETIKNIK